MLVDYGDQYMYMRSNRRTYELEIVKLINKDDISPEEAEPLLAEGKKFFEHTEKAVTELLKKHGIDFD